VWDADGQGITCTFERQQVSCPGSGTKAYKEALVVRGRTVKEGSNCSVTRKGGGPELTVHGKAHNGECVFDHPFP
jgi:hypothetical protein